MTQTRPLELGRDPVMRKQLTYFIRPLRRQARENVLQVSIRIMSIQSRRLDQAHDRRSPFSTA